MCVAVIVCKRTGVKNLAVFIDFALYSVINDGAGALRFLAEHEIVNGAVCIICLVVKNRTVGAEVIIAYGEETVIVCAMESLILDSGALIVPVEEVILTVNELHTGLAQAILDIVNIAVPSCKTGVVPFALRCAVFIEYVPCILLKRIVIIIVDPASTGRTIALLVDAVILTVNGVPLKYVLAASEVRRTFEILDALRITVPLTGNKLAVFFKLIGYIAVVISWNSSVSGLIKIVPLIVDGYPSGNRTAAGIIVIVAVDILKAVRNVCNCAADAAYLLAILEDPAVSGSRNGCSPLYYGVAILAVGSAGVAVLCAAGSLVGNSYSGMNVGCAMFSEIDLVDGGKVAIHLGIDMELLVGEGAGSAVDVCDNALVDVHLQILRIEVIGCPIRCGVIAGNIDIGVEIDDADRDLCEDRRAGLIILTGTGDGDGSGIGHGLACGSILGGKAVRKYHMIELPMVDIVEVDLSGNRLDGLDRIRLEIHPIDRAEGNSVESRVSGNQLQCRSGGAGLDLDNANNDRLVACVIADLEFDAVIAVRYGIAVSAHNAVRVRNVDLNAVDISLRGVGIDSADVIKREGIGAV